ncbi:hypothetical protein, partial [Escherichia coli]|uniref:hypothetical protein n=1 Tax=Escherichia coli TaxID=562 RepID=UPI003CF3A848
KLFLSFVSLLYTLSYHTKFSKKKKQPIGRFLAQPLFKSFVIFFLPKERVTSSVNEVTLSLDLTLIRQWLLHQCLIQTIVMEKLNLVRCS